jgi:vacuolar-type H+-ATPase subunit H
MRWPYAVLTTVALVLTGGCQSGLTRADQSVDHAKQSVDDSVERAKRQIDDSVDRATQRLREAVKDAQESTSKLVEQTRASYDQELKETRAEVDRLREALNKDVADLDRRVQERLDQIRTSALTISQDVDGRVQARIDQVFTELRLFMTEVLARIEKMIEPIMKVASSVSSAVDNGNRYIADITTKFGAILIEVEKTTSEVRKAISQFRGVDPETGKDKPGTPWIEIVGGLMAAAFIAWRKIDQRKNGDRWKEEELTEKTHQDVSKGIMAGEFDAAIRERIASGQFDDALRSRLVSLGALKVQPVLSREGGDPPQEARRVFNPGGA